MKSATSIPTKLDVVKLETYDFLENERLGSERMHERNIRTDISHHRNDELAAPEQKITPSYEESPIEWKELEVEMVEDFDCSRFAQSKKSHISEATIDMDNRIDHKGSAPKRYTTRCFIQLKNVPYRYTESVILNIGTKKRKYENKIFFQQKCLPVKWSEMMCTEITTFPKSILSEKNNTVEDIYIELRAA